MTDNVAWIWHDEIDSSQDFVLGQLAKADVGKAESFPHGAGVGAGTQSAGRGRSGNSWSSAEGSSVALSTIIRPASLDTQFTSSDLAWLTLVAATAFVNWYRELGVEASVKWPNDVLGPDGRKMVGILASYHAGSTPEQAALVIGTGINRDFGDGPRPVPEAAGLTDYLSEALPELSAEDFARMARDRIVSAVEEFASTWATEGEEAAVAPIAAVMSTLGQRIRGELPGNPPSILTGTAVRLGSGGTLIVRPDNLDALKHESLAPVAERKKTEGLPQVSDQKKTEGLSQVSDKKKTEGLPQTQVSDQKKTEGLVPVAERKKHEGLQYPLVAVSSAVIKHIRPIE